MPRSALLDVPAASGPRDPPRLIHSLGHPQAMKTTCCCASGQGMGVPPRRTAPDPHPTWLPLPMKPPTAQCAGGRPRRLSSALQMPRRGWGGGQSDATQGSPTAGAPCLEPPPGQVPGGYRSAQGGGLGGPVGATLCPKVAKESPCLAMHLLVGAPPSTPSLQGGGLAMLLTLWGKGARREREIPSKGARDPAHLGGTHHKSRPEVSL